MHFSKKFHHLQHPNSKQLGRCQLPLGQNVCFELLHLLNGKKQQIIFRWLHSSTKRIRRQSWPKSSKQTGGLESAEFTLDKYVVTIELWSVPKPRGKAETLRLCSLRVLHLVKKKRPNKWSKSHQELRVFSWSDFSDWINTRTAKF